MKTIISQIKNTLKKTQDLVLMRWATLSIQGKLLTILLLIVGFVTLMNVINSYQELELQRSFKDINHVEIQGIMSEKDHIVLPQEHTINLAKTIIKNDEHIVLFVNSASSRASVKNLVLFKSKEQTKVVYRSLEEIESLIVFIKENRVMDRISFVDWKLLSVQERNLIEGLALKLGPMPEDRENKETKALINGIVGLLFNGVFIYIIFKQLSFMNKSLKFLRPQDIKGDLSDLVGMEDVKKDVLRVKGILTDKEYFKSYGVDRPVNILFSGPPGTGKTKLAGYLAKELNLPILFHSAANLETGFVNGGASTLERVAKMAAHHRKCIIFLDEAQGLFMKRQRQNGTKFDDDTQNTLLAILDGVKTSKDAEIIWIVASNFNSNNMEMDEAMLRRFPLKIDFRLPNNTERKNIFNFYLKKAGDNVQENIDLTPVMHMTESASPADIESIVYEAGLMAVTAKTKITSWTLAQAAERMIIGNTDTETTQGREKEREIIAIHEVGHFLIDFIRHEMTTRDPSKIIEKMGAIKISLKANARSKALGFVFKKNTNNLLRTKNDMEWEIKTLFGGMVNEELFFGSDGVTNGAYSDIQEVTKIIHHNVAAMGMYKTHKLNLTTIYQAHQSFEIQEEDRLIMERESARLYKETQELLRQRKNLSRFLADHLIQKVEMGTEEMIKLIQEFEFALVSKTE